MNIIKQIDPFLQNKNNMGSPTMNLSVGQQIMVATKGGVNPSFKAESLTRENKERGIHQGRGDIPNKIQSVEERFFSL